MRLFRSILVVFGLLLTATTLSAQTDSLRLGYSVRGNVVDALSGQALEAVHVSIPR